MYAIKHILHATDFSPHSNQAYFYATTLAEKFGAALTILHVHHREVHVAVTPEMAPILFDEPPDVRQYWLEQLRQIRPLNESIELRHVLLEGQPAKEIVHYAETHAIELIVMGTHGRSGLGRLIAGSVAASVLANAHCPVLIVKLPTERSVEQAAHESN